jgi:2-keto-4-pentenoate hydratase/2-oxohepta-3-ene-1,7-dioic acid hydratase in catechol pathway
LSASKRRDFGGNMWVERVGGSPSFARSGFTDSCGNRIDIEIDSFRHVDATKTDEKDLCAEAVDMAGTIARRLWGVRARYLWTTASEDRTGVERFVLPRYPSSVRIARFITGSDPRYAVVEGDPGAEVLAVVQGAPIFSPVRFTGERLPLDTDGLRLLAPVIPRSKIVGIGRNYVERLPPGATGTPGATEHPLVFLKPNTSVIGPDDPIVLPPTSQDVHYEGELAVVIGRICKDVPRERVAEVVVGYTCANDVTARDLQRDDGQWWRAKGSDTFCPLGPYLVTDLDPSDVRVTTRLDGRTVQEASTATMVRDVAELIALVSAAMTLLPGDVLLTGTPGGAGPLAPGQRVEVEVDGIGTLSNPVVRR